MSDLFISYSRADREFVSKLHSALSNQGSDVWVDWEDIRPTEQWFKSILSAIEAANALVFVISPDSVKSRICSLEINHAAAHQKRLVPLVFRDAPVDKVNEQLAALNWIFFRESDDFESAVGKLRTALAVDFEWMDEHTRLLGLALQWERGGRRSDGLLRGGDQRSAEA